MQGGAARLRNVQETYRMSRDRLDEISYQQMIRRRPLGRKIRRQDQGGETIREIHRKEAALGRIVSRRIRTSSLVIHHQAASRQILPGDHVERSLRNSVLRDLRDLDPNHLLPLLMLCPRSLLKIIFKNRLHHMKTDFSRDIFGSLFSSPSFLFSFPITLCFDLS